VTLDKNPSPTYVSELRDALAESLPRLQRLTEAEAGRQPRPGKWCPSEIIGHLIDSASVNHQRFLNARVKDDLVFAGYDQDELVAAQNYREAPWSELVMLWHAYNLHIARVMEAIPVSERERPRTRHNLDEIAWQTVPRNQPATLDYLMSDYVGHLKHHLAQISFDGD
jgi:hypothetical protein